jgi:hypothetical protein
MGRIDSHFSALDKHHCLPKGVQSVVGKKALQGTCSIITSSLYLLLSIWRLLGFRSLIWVSDRYSYHCNISLKFINTKSMSQRVGDRSTDQQLIPPVELCPLVYLLRLLNLPSRPL